MSKRSIEVIVSPGGSISIEALNFKGADCEQATKFLEQALGAVTTKRHKPEYTQRARNQSRQRVGS